MNLKVILALLNHSAKEFLKYYATAVLLFSVACTSTTRTTPRTAPEPAPEQTEEARQAAEAELQKAQEQKIKDDIIYEINRAYGLGIDRVNLRDYEGALKLFLKANRLDKALNADNLKYPGIYQRIGRAYIERGMPDSTLYYYKEALQYNTGNKLLYLSWIQWFYYNQAGTDISKFDDYIEVTEEILKEPVDDAKKIQYLTTIKAIYKSRGDNEKEYETILRLLMLEPDNKDLDLERIGLLKKLFGDEALQEEYEKQHQENPTDLEVIWRLITTYGEQGLYDKIIEFTDKYIELKPDDIEARLKKIDALKALGNYDDAITVFQELSKLDPGEPDYLLEIAEIYNTDKTDLREALKWAFSARRVNPNYGRANFMMGVLIRGHVDYVRAKYNRDNFNIDDKLIGEIALSYYKDAAKDPNWKGQADRYISYYETEGGPIRSGADKFMHKDWTTPKIQDYTWIWQLYRKK